MPCLPAPPGFLRLFGGMGYQKGVKYGRIETWTSPLSSVLPPLSTMYPRLTFDGLLTPLSMTAGLMKEKTGADICLSVLTGKAIPLKSFIILLIVREGYEVP